MMKKNYSITITHLYPNHMNIYGDIGNVIALKQRCEWRDIRVEILEMGFRQTLPKSTDIYFMGGGQDADQLAVFKDLLKKRDALKKHIESGTCFLAVCGAYQLLGNYFLTGDGKKIDGLAILPVNTEASDVKVKTRCIGNLVGKLNEKIFRVDELVLDTIVGFENHSGQTYLSSELEPLAKVIKGYGNNMKDRFEGCVYKNVIGTYCHGSFLPKNPHITDWIIEKAMKRKYGPKYLLPKLDSAEEVKAHVVILERLGVR